MGGRRGINRRREEGGERERWIDDEGERGSISREAGGEKVFTKTSERMRLGED